MEEYGRDEAYYYDLLFTGLPGDVEFYVEEAAKSGSPVLELACGTGRVLIPTAKAGVDITGVDLSEHMLAICRSKVGSLGVDVQERVQLMHGDMRTFELDRKFKLITIPYRAFLHLLTTEDQRQCLDRIREHLEDDGRLILNFFDPRLDILAGRMGVTSGALKKESEFHNPATGNQVFFWSSGKDDPQRQVIEQTWIFEEVDSNGTSVKRTFTPLALRWMYRYEMQHLLELCGFKVEALYGDFYRGPFRYGGEQVWVAGKA